MSIPCIVCLITPSKENSHILSCCNQEFCISCATKWYEKSPNKFTCPNCRKYLYDYTFAPMSLEKLIQQDESGYHDGQILYDQVGQADYNNIQTNYYDIQVDYDQVDYDDQVDNDDRQIDYYDYDGPVYESDDESDDENDFDEYGFSDQNKDYNYSFECDEYGVPLVVN